MAHDDCCSICKEELDVNAEYLSMPCIVTWLQINNSEDCPICLEEFDVNIEFYIMSCNHGFHQQCIVT
ncbi:hypothetical protein CR513_44580, partial [Mucuna pruriens]